MPDLHIKIVDVPGEEAWTAELWPGFPGTPGAVKLAGGDAKYTRAQLERDDNGLQLDKASVLDAIRTEEQPNAIFTRAGVRLFELLQATGVAAAWKAQRVQGERTYLETPPSIAEWPWELLAEQVYRNLTAHFFDKPLYPVMRVFPQMIQPDLRWIDSTIRILLVSGEEVLDAAKGLKASDELRRIREVFHKSGLSALVELCESPAMKEDLPSAIREFSPHIIHFIGHGDKGDEPGAEYFLQFKRNTTWEWTTNEIHSFFDAQTWKPRLVLLNACHASRFEKHAASVSEALLVAGIPAVIGAQAALRVDYARYFAGAFYEALARERALDKAMCAARSALTAVAQYQGQDRRHWALPILTVTAPPDRILQFKPANAQVKACPIIRGVYERPGRFVGRVADRWSLISAFEPPRAGDPRYRGVILSGAPEQGKSWLVKRSIRDFLDAGYMVRYAELSVEKTAETRTSADVLLDWRGNPRKQSPLLGPIPGSDFDDFDKAYASRKPASVIFEAFKDGLQKARAGRKVLLILDRFRRNADSTWVNTSDFREGLMSQLLLPLQATGPEDASVGGIYALLVARQYSGVVAGAILDEDEFGLRQLDGFARKVLNGFEKDQVDNLFDEYSDFTTKPGADGLRIVLRAMAKTDPWKPTVLGPSFEEMIVNLQNL